MPFDGNAAVPVDVAILCNAKNLIHDPLYWTKKAYAKGGRRCLLQALRDGCAMHYQGKPLPREFGHEDHVKRLATLLVTEMGGRWPSCCARVRLIRFNDNKRRQHAEIMALFDRTIARRWELAPVH